MPFGAKKMADESAHQKKEILEEQEYREQKENSKKEREEPIIREPKGTSIYKLMVAAYQIFLDESDKAGFPTRVERGKFDHIFNGKGHTTVTKVKRRLGVISEKDGSGGGWWWSFPKYSPEQYQKQHRILIKEKNEMPPVDLMSRNMHHPCCKALMECMIDNNYEASNTDVWTYMIEEVGFSRRTILKFKKFLGIVSVKKPDGWKWFWIHREIKLWLETKLEQGPMLRTQVEILAKDEKDWSWELMVVAKKQMGNIQVRWFKGDPVPSWLDINSRPDLAAPEPGGNKTVVEVDNTPDLDDTEIAVDFSENEEDTEFSPDEEEGLTESAIVIGDRKIKVWE